MNVLGIIPARAGSKGVRNKNLILVAGKPAIAYTIEAARQSKYVNRLVVSTESPDIAEVARDLGAEVVDRPAELATDTARLDYVLRHAMDVLREREGYKPDVICLLYANVPLREDGIIDRCVEHLVKHGGSSVRTLSWVGKHHPQWMMRLAGDRIESYEKLVIYRRQDLERLYIHDAACVAISYRTMADSIHHLDDNFNLYGPDPRGVVCADGATVDIDEAGDVFIAEAALRMRAEKGSHYALGDNQADQNR